MGRLQGKFFADGSERNGIRDRARLRAEAGHRFTHAEVPDHTRK